jgi:cysteinyl-tRNA synthetase
MHNGMIETDAEKMSKSEGNIFQLSEALDRYGHEAVVAYLISGHYRQPLAFGAEQMEQAVARVERLRNFFREHPVGGRDSGESAGAAGPVAAEEVSGLTRPDTSSSTPPAGEAVSPESRLRAFREALADDFNTPRAMAEISELVGEANRGEISGAPETVKEMLELLGLGSLASEKVHEGSASVSSGLSIKASGETLSPAEVLLEEREDARAAKDFARADEIRDQLAEMGWEVRDSADGAKLVPKA